MVCKIWLDEPSLVGRVIATVPKPSASAYATPSIYKSLYCSDDVPKSFELLVDGLTSPDIIAPSTVTIPLANVNRSASLV